MKKFDIKIITFNNKDHLENQINIKVAERQETNEVLEVVVTDMKPMTDDIAKILGIGSQDLGWASVMIVYE